MQATAEAQNRPPLVSADELKLLQQRSDAKGLTRLAIHVSAMAATGALYGMSFQRGAHPLLIVVLGTLYGFTLVTHFATMHESVHRTAFKSRSLNDTVAWFAGLFSFYNSTFYRYYHGWHHRFTQLPGQDPELEDAKPTTVSNYLLQMSGLPWWIGKLQTHFRIAAGQVQGYPFLNTETRPKVVRSVRLQLSVYALAITASLVLSQPLFVVWWLLPVALAQPLLRAILLAEHGGCSENDDPLSNTRSTYTVLPVRILMWDMPYHAEHHRYPALPFFALSRAHEHLRPHLRHVARRGYSGMHIDFLRGLAARPDRGALSD